MQGHAYPELELNSEIIEFGEISIINLCFW